jgi:hypothetical protein
MPRRQGLCIHMQSFNVRFRQARAFQHRDFAKGVPFVPGDLAGMGAWRFPPQSPRWGDDRGES